jgi:hypothetical protein
MHGAAVLMDQVSLGRLAVGYGNVTKVSVVGLLSRPKDDPHVHHNVNKKRFRRDEGAEVPSLLLETQSQSLTGLDENFTRLGSIRELVPMPIGGHEDESQVMNVAVGLAMLQRRTIMLGSFAPITPCRQVVQEPQNSR